MSVKIIFTAKFRIGRIVSTPNALERLTPDDIFLAIQRHQSGDWGDVGDDDRQENELSLKEGFRLFSVKCLLTSFGPGRRDHCIDRAGRSK